MNLKTLFRQRNSHYDPTPDDLTVTSNGLVMARTERNEVQDELDHLWFEVEEREAGQVYQGYKVVKLIMLRYLPQEAKKDAGLVAKTKTALVGLYNSRVRFDIVQVVAGMFDPPIGVMQCYGVASFEPEKQAAIEQADLGMAAMRAVLANYTQSRFVPLDGQKAAWLLAALGGMPNALVAIGHPDARQNPRGGGRDTPEEQMDTAGQGAYTLQQNEQLFRGMSALNEEFVFMLIAHKINLTEIARMLAGISGEASVWASRTTGMKGISFGLSVPISLSGGIARQAGTTYAENDGRSASETIGDSRTLTHTEGVATTVGHADTHTVSHEVGHSHTDGNTVSIAHGVSSEQGQSHGTNESTSWAHTDGRNESWGTTHSVSSSQSVATTDSHTTGATVTKGVATGVTTSDGVARSANWQASASQQHGVQDGEGGGWTTTVGGSHSVGRQAGVSMVVSGGGNESSTESASGADSKNWSKGTSDTQGNSVGAGGGVAISNQVAKNVTGSNAVAAVNTRTTGVSVSSSSSESNSSSHEVGVSSSDMVGGSKGTSESRSTSQGQSNVVTSARASSDTSSESFGESWGETNSWSRTQSVSDAVADGQSRGVSMGQTYGSSLGRGLSVGRSLGLSGGVIPTISASKSYNWVDAAAQQVAELYRTHEAILVDASKEGAYLTDVYMLTRSRTGLAAAQALVRQAFHGSEKVVTSFQSRALNADEQAYIRRHVAAFTPSTRVETIPGVLEGYKDTTLLPPEKLAALFAPGLFERGPAVTTEERIPAFAFIPDLKGDAVLGRLWDFETHTLTNAELRLSEDKHMHTAFCGDTGYGKTVGAERLCVEAVNRWHHRAVVLDWGQGWRKLLNSPIPRSRVQVYQLHERAVRPLRWNPLQIGKRVGPNAQCEATVEIFANIGRLGSKQSSFMLRALRKVYTLAGVFTSDPEVQDHPVLGRVIDATEQTVVAQPIGTWLTALDPDQLQALAVQRSKAIDLTDWINQVRVEIKAMKSSDPNRSALESVVVRMERLTHGTAGRRYAKGDDSMAIEDLGLIGPTSDPWGVAVLEGGAEMDGYSKSVLLSLIAWHLYNDAVSRRRESIGRKLPALNIFFEEANKIFLGVETSGDTGNQPPPVSNQILPMFTDGRKFRVYCHPVLQAVNMLPDAILSSCVNICVGQSKGIRDRDAILAHLAKSEKGFTDEEYKRFVSKMPPKMIICKLGYGEHLWETGAMLCEIDLVAATEPTEAELPLH